MCPEIDCVMHRNSKMNDMYNLDATFSQLNTFNDSVILAIYCRGGAESWKVLNCGA